MVEWWCVIFSDLCLPIFHQMLVPADRLSLIGGRQVKLKTSSRIHLFGSEIGGACLIYHLCISHNAPWLGGSDARWNTCVRLTHLQNTIQLSWMSYTMAQIYKWDMYKRFIDLDWQKTAKYFTKYPIWMTVKANLLTSRISTLDFNLGPCTY